MDCPHCHQTQLKMSLIRGQCSFCHQPILAMATQHQIKQTLPATPVLSPYLQIELTPHTATITYHYRFYRYLFIVLLAWLLLGVPVSLETPGLWAISCQRPTPEGRCTVTHYHLNPWLLFWRSQQTVLLKPGSRFSYFSTTASKSQLYPLTFQPAEHDLGKHLATFEWERDAGLKVAELNAFLVASPPVQLYLRQWGYLYMFFILMPAIGLLLLALWGWLANKKYHGLHSRLILDASEQQAHFVRGLLWRTQTYHYPLAEVSLQWQTRIVKKQEQVQWVMIAPTGGYERLTPWLNSQGTNGMLTHQ